MSEIRLHYSKVFSEKNSDAIFSKIRKTTKKGHLSPHFWQNCEGDFPGEGAEIWKHSLNVVKRTAFGLFENSSGF